MRIRKHGDWLPLDWLWLAPFVLLASLHPGWRRRYWSTYVTTSVFTETCYTPDGDAPDLGLWRHELKHMEQAMRDGKVRFALRYVLSQKWRIRYEGEAFAVQGVPRERVIELLREQYFITWKPERIRGEL